jgi:hypothetical protein
MMQDCSWCGRAPDDYSRCKEPECSQCDPEILQIIADYKKATGADKVHFSIDTSASAAEIKSSLRDLMRHLIKLDADYEAVPQWFRHQDEVDQLKDLISQISRHGCKDFESLRDHVFKLTDIIALSQETTVSRWNQKMQKLAKEVFVTK